MEKIIEKWNQLNAEFNTEMEKIESAYNDLDIEMCRLGIKKYPAAMRKVFVERQAIYQKIHNINEDHANSLKRLHIKLIDNINQEKILRGEK